MDKHDEKAREIQHRLRDAGVPWDALFIAGAQNILATALRAAAAEGKREWRDIATAPLNKTMVALLHVKGPYRRYGVGRYMPLEGWQGWHRSDDPYYVPPTHWAVLPEPPATDEREK